ncbi:MAG: glycosyltransferase family 4 protein [Patescibacteria group bacterium]
MKILHVSKKYPQALGGDAVVVSSLREQQQAAGHEVVIVTSNCDEIASAANVYKFGLRDTPARLDEITPKRIVSLAVLFFQMFIILRKERPDVIHTHSVDMAFVISAAARCYGIPTVHTFHIVTFYDVGQAALRRKTELWLAKRARLHIATAPNTYDVKKLQKAGLEQTVLLPNGIDLPFWQGRTRAKEGESFTFLTVGRLEHQKGYDYLIKATALLTRTLPVSSRVIIVGQGSQEATLCELIRKQHVEDVVTLVGRKSPEEVRVLFSQANAAVFPSLYETTPVTVLEAWAARLPVIVSSVGILRDVPVGFDAAYIVPPGDEEALAKAMGQCRADTQTRKAIADRGYEEATKYAWPQVAQTAEAIYRSVQ